MENNESRLGRFFTQIGDKLNDQVWFQQLKGKWDELDAQSKLAVRIGSVVVGVLLLLVIVFGQLSSVRSLEKELADKSELLTTIQTAQEELRRLREVSGGAQASAGGEANWAPFFEAQAAASGIDKEKLTVDTGKPGADTPLAKESLHELGLKGVNIKQIVRYAFHLENAGRPVKLRNLSIDTQGDMSGYLDATISVSAFAAKE
jgi:hypothetical protein